jgi:hypothetical protein
MEMQEQRFIRGPTDDKPGLAWPAHVYIDLLLDKPGLNPV